MTTDADAAAWASPKASPSRADLRIQEAQLNRARRGKVLPTRELQTGVKIGTPIVNREHANADDEERYDAIGVDLARFAELSYRERSHAEHRELRRLESRLARAGVLARPR